MKPHGTVQLSLWVSRKCRDDVRALSKSRRVTQSAFVEQAVKEKVERIRGERGELLGGTT